MYTGAGVSVVRCGASSPNLGPAQHTYSMSLDALSQEAADSSTDLGHLALLRLAGWPALRATNRGYTCLYIR